MKNTLTACLMMAVVLAAVGCRSGKASSEPTESAPAAGTSSPAPGAPADGQRKKGPLRDVLFFTLSSEELMNAEMQEGEGGGTSFIVEEFELAASEFMENPGMDGLNIQFTDVKKITIAYGKNYFNFDRPSDETGVGVILSDGLNEPKVIRGIQTADVYRKAVLEYFGE